MTTHTFIMSMPYLRAVTGSNFLDDYTYFTEGELSVGLLGVTESNFKATDYSDWTATTTWTTDSTSLEVSMGMAYHLYTSQ